MGFDFEVVYRPKKENTPPDALSRCDNAQFASLTLVSKPVFGILRSLRRLFLHQTEAKKMFEKVHDNPNQFEDFTIRDGLLLFKGRIWVPNDVTLKELICQEYYDSSIGGHAGIQRTLARIAACFYWPSMRSDVVAHIRQCAVCQQTKALNTAPPELLQALPVPSQIWSDITMDFITHLPVSQGKTVVMVVVDRLSKYAHFCPMKSGFTALSVAKVFVRDICRLHGILTSITSDRDPMFINNFEKEFFTLLGTTLSHNSAYHPQTDGQTEVMNQILEDYLRCYVSENQTSWVEWLPLAEYHYNTAKHSGLQYSPFEVVYGRAPPKLLDYELGSTLVASVDD